MSWEAFEPDPEFVRSQILKGKLDYVEVASQVAETRFFEYVLKETPWEELVGTFPSPRKKHEVPLWLYLSSQVSLRLHGLTGYGAYPYVIHAGGLSQVLGRDQAWWKQDSGTGRSSLHFEGYNEKNTYERRTPCDPDWLRKMARSTDEEKLAVWFSAQLPRYLDMCGMWDKEGIVLVDGTYLFVPDNERYENSSRMWFDEHNHPTGPPETPQERAQVRLRRCYRAVEILHTNRHRDWSVYAGLAMGTGSMAESPCLGPMIERLAGSLGAGKVKLVIHDRGFIDGKTMTFLKRDLGVDSLFPMKRNMQDWQDAERLAEADGRPWQVWRPPQDKPPPAPPARPAPLQAAEEKRQATVRRQKAERIGKGEQKLPVTVDHVELKCIGKMRLWDASEVPLSVVVMREHLSDGTVNVWGLGTTREGLDPLEVWDLYKIRTGIEEGHRQTKCFWDLTRFRSTDYGLVFAQVVFTLLAFTLMQVFLAKGERPEWAGRNRQRLWDSLLPSGEQILAYAGGRVAFLDAITFAQWMVSVPEGARRRLNGRLQELQRQKMSLPDLPLRPTGFQP